MWHPNFASPTGFEEEPEDAVVAEGDKAVFHCSIVTQTGTSLVWSNGTGQVTSSGRSQIAVNGTLTIQPTADGDEGTYTCTWTTATSSLSGSAVLRFACECVCVVCMSGCTGILANVVWWYGVYFQIPTSILSHMMK